MQLTPSSAGKYPVSCVSLRDDVSNFSEAQTKNAATRTEDIRFQIATVMMLILLSAKNMLHVTFEYGPRKKTSAVRLAWMELKSAYIYSLENYANWCQPHPHMPLFS